MHINSSGGFRLISKHGASAERESELGILPVYLVLCFQWPVRIADRGGGQKYAVLLLVLRAIVPFIILQKTGSSYREDILLSSDFTSAPPHIPLSLSHYSVRFVCSLIFSSQMSTGSTPLQILFPALDFFTFLTTVKQKREKSSLGAEAVYRTCTKAKI